MKSRLLPFSVATGILALAFISTTSMAQVIVELEPDRDNTLYESATGGISNGQGTWLYFGRTNAAIRRALLRFDLSPIPPGATILDADLSFEVDRQSSSASEALASLHRMTSDWGEGGSNAGAPGGSGTTAQLDDATWLHRFFETQVWNQPGGDFNTAISASTTITGLGEFEFSGNTLRDDVQLWIDNPSQNFGWMIRGDEVSARSARRIGSRENAELKPTLEITYQAAEAPAFSGIGTAVQGSWFNPARAGEGFVFDFFTRGAPPNNVGLVVYFYTYDLEDRPLYLVGSVEGLTAGSSSPILVEVIQTQGTSFGTDFNATDVAVIPWGDLLIEFFDCESGQVSWFPNTLGFGEGQTLIQRLVPLSDDLTCQ